MVHQNLRRLSGVFRDQLVVVLRQTYLVHLTRLAKPLEINAFILRYTYPLLMLLEALFQIPGIDRSPICLANQQSVIPILFTEESLILFDPRQSLVQFIQQWRSQILFPMAVFRFRPLENHAAFRGKHLLGEDAQYLMFRQHADCAV